MKKRLNLGIKNQFTFIILFYFLLLLDVITFQINPSFLNYLLKPLYFTPLFYWLKLNFQDRNKLELKLLIGFLLISLVSTFFSLNPIENALFLTSANLLKLVEIQVVIFIFVGIAKRKNITYRRRLATFMIPCLTALLFIGFTIQFFEDGLQVLIMIRIFQFSILTAYALNLTQISYLFAVFTFAIAFGETIAAFRIGGFIIPQSFLIQELLVIGAKTPFCIAVLSTYKT